MHTTNYTHEHTYPLCPRLYISNTSWLENVEDEHEEETKPNQRMRQHGTEKTQVQHYLYDSADAPTQSALKPNIWELNDTTRLNSSLSL